VKAILRVGMQAARGLAAAHAQGIVHRDIKPANILLENGIERVKITDFGLARAVDDASITQSGVIAGTPLYMSPEQANGEAVDPRSDLFSLGSVLYALCTGHPPFRADSTARVLLRVASDTPRPVRELNPDIPDWLEAIIAKLLAKKREERFQEARDVADLLEQHLAHLQQPHLAPRPAPVTVPRTEPSGPVPLHVDLTAARRGKVGDRGHGLRRGGRLRFGHRLPLTAAG
jgi:serine/threonine protein kinase